MSAYGSDFTCSKINGKSVSEYEKSNLSQVLTKSNDGANLGMISIGEISGATSVGCTSVTASGQVAASSAAIGTSGSEQLTVSISEGKTVLMIDALPTSDPNSAGQVWNHNGVLTVSGSAGGGGGNGV